MQVLFHGVMLYKQMIASRNICNTIDIVKRHSPSLSTWDIAFNLQDSIQSEKRVKSIAEEFQ